MSPRGPIIPRLRLGLQAKATLVLGLLICVVSLSGGWMYYRTSETWLRKADLDRVEHMGEALSIAAEGDLRNNRYLSLKKLVRQRVGRDKVVYAAVLNRHGQVVASGGEDSHPGRWESLAELPLSLALVRHEGADLVVICQPVQSREAVLWEDHLAGAIRMVVDAGDTSQRLATVRKRTAWMAGAVVFVGIALGYVLVWRVMVRPMHQLAQATRRLADGDFSARSRLRRGDEIGALSKAFDSMAERISAARDELVLANEILEEKVAERTGELGVVNDRLRREMAEKEDFLRAVSHDLNAPLRNIAGMATMIQMKWGGQLPEDVARRLERIQSNVEHETSLIGELLELSRIRSRPLKRSVADMGELAAEAAAAVEYERKARGITLTIQPEMPTLYVERSRLVRVFQNLLDNAIKYMDKSEGGRIEVGYDPADSHHRFWVRDNGPGIPADQHEKIFRVFRRAESPRAAEVQGKGVGLALVRGIASNHEGLAWVESTPGQGATFTISLDRANTRPPRKDERHESPANRRTTFTGQRDHHPAGG